MLKMFSNLTGDFAVYNNPLMIRISYNTRTFAGKCTVERVSSTIIHGKITVNLQDLQLDIELQISNSDRYFIRSGINYLI